MAEDKSQRTEPATPRRREETRRKGQVAQSRDLQSFAVLGASAVALGFLGVGLARTLEATMRWSFQRIADPPHSRADFTAAFLQQGGAQLEATLPFLVAVPVAAGLVQLAQVGPLLSFEALKFRGDRIDPVKGFGRLVKPDRWVDLLKTLVKVAAISLVAWWAFLPSLDHVLNLSRAEPGEAVLTFGTVMLRVSAAVLAVLGAIAAVDTLLQRQRHEREIRMSRREVRDELKQVEGDPAMRSRYRARQQELSRTRMIAAVAEADVVVTNPTHFAVALRYERSMAAPHVTAKGKDRVAARIRQAAIDAGVPVMEDAPLARLLHRTCEVGREIPENLFQAVAELLAVVYRAGGRERAGR